MRTGMKTHLFMVALVVATVTGAARSAYAEQAVCNDCSFATDPELENIRGGFVAGDGLEISFGIEKAVFVNGVLQAVSTLNLPGWGSEQGQTLSDQVLSNMVVLRQSGNNNMIAPNLVANSPSGLFTYIQNSLDNAVIKNITQINASVNSLNMYRDMNLKSMMNQQLLNAMR